MIFIYCLQQRKWGGVDPKNSSSPYVQQAWPPSIRGNQASARYDCQEEAKDIKESKVFLEEAMRERKRYVDRSYSIRQERVSGSKVKK